MKNDFEMEMVLTVESMMSRVQATGLVCVDAKVVDRHGTGKVESWMLGEMGEASCGLGQEAYFQGWSMMDNAANLHLLQFQQVKCNSRNIRNSIQFSGEFSSATVFYTWSSLISIQFSHPVRIFPCTTISKENHTSVPTSIPTRNKQEVSLASGC